MFLAQLKLFSMDGNQMNVVSLFAGCGGSSLGYKWAGCNVRLALEFQKYAAEVYRLNHPHTPVIEKDIRKVSGQELLDCAGLGEGEVDIVDGSPPCSGFSVCGNVEKDWGKVKVYSAGIKQRVDDLFFEYARLIGELEPMVFVAENVKGLTMGASAEILGSHQTSMFPEDTPRTIIDVLNDLGYTVRYKVLNAKDYSVPQARERLFIIGYRKDLCITPSFPKPHKRVISTREAIEDLMDNGSDHEASERSKRLVKEWFGPMTSGADIKRIAEDHGIEVFFQHFIRDKWDVPFNTITKHHTRPYHPKVDRLLSIDEAKRIQSFPDDFILPHSPAQNWERIGRAVPPLLMKAIVLNILSDLERSK